MKADARLAEELMREVTNQREDVVDLCRDLVAAPSVNPDGDTRLVASVVKQALETRGVTATFEQREPTMPSVLASLDSGRPGPHLVLNVHLDTMPPGDESLWSVPVFSLTRRQGRLYGLGMGNMKGAVAAMVTATALLDRWRDSWRGKVTFTGVSDEVVFGENGAAYLMRQQPDLLGDGLLCGEGPGFRRLALGEKGVLWLEISTVGDPGHASAATPGETASARLAEAALRIDALTGRTGTLPPEFMQNEQDDDPGLMLTANVGVIRSGTFVGQRATCGTAEVDLRIPPGLTVAETEEMVRAAVADIPGTSVRRVKGWDPNWTSASEPLTRAWQAAHLAVTGHSSTYAIRLPASDASRWRQQGVPALCFGPQPGLSAGVDDYAEEEDVLRSAALYTLAAITFLTSYTPSTDSLEGR
jgi:succinyl-diaminopimelate desuccinylase